MNKEEERKKYTSLQIMYLNLDLQFESTMYNAIYRDYVSKGLCVHVRDFDVS